MYLLLSLFQDSCYSSPLLTGRGADLPVKPRFFLLVPSFPSFFLLVSSRIHHVRDNRTKRTRLRMGVVEGGRRWAEPRTEVKPCHSSGSKRRVQCSVNSGSDLSSLPPCQLCRWGAALILFIVSRLSFMGTSEHRKLTAFMCTGVCRRTRSIESSG